MSAASRDTLEELGRKYREMLAMRLEHASGAEDASRARERMARLASRFPGALREIDRLDLDEIHHRIRRLDEALVSKLDDGDVLEPWMEAVALFHAFTRGALGTKRWLAGRKAVDAATTRDFASHAAGAPHASDLLAWVQDLARVASPPRGRLLDVVFLRLARALGTSEQEARLRVFGAARATVPGEGSSLYVDEGVEGVDGVEPVAGAAFVSAFDSAFAPSELVAVAGAAVPDAVDSAAALGLDDE